MPQGGKVGKPAPSAVFFSCASELRLARSWLMKRWDILSCASPGGYGLNEKGLTAAGAAH